MIKILKSFVLLFAVGTVFSNVYAIEESMVPENQRSTTGLYFTSEEASDHMAKNSKSTLFVDVRDPAEIFTVGMPVSANVNVPFKRIDLNKWDQKKSTFQLPNNPDFVTDVDARLKVKGLGRDDTIILLCGSGKRAAKAASALKKSGYTKVYSVMGGYKGWRKANLKWSRKLDKGKMYVTLTE